MTLNIHTIIQRSAITIVLLTIFGILVHETKADKAASMLAVVPTAALAGLVVIPHLASEGHNHVERVSFDGVTRDLRNGQPRLRPRTTKKYRLQKFVAKGVHAFDGYYQPLGEL